MLLQKSDLEDVTLQFESQPQHDIMLIEVLADVISGSADVRFAVFENLSGLGTSEFAQDGKLVSESARRIALFT